MTGVRLTQAKIIRLKNLLPMKYKPSEIAQVLGWAAPKFYKLDTPYTSTSWDGDSFSTTAKTLVDLSAVFGVPAGVKAILVRVAIQDSGASSSDCYLILGQTNEAAVGIPFGCFPANDRWNRKGGWLCPAMPMGTYIIKSRPAGQRRATSTGRYGGTGYNEK